MTGNNDSDEANGSLSDMNSKTSDREKFYRVQLVDHFTQNEQRDQRKSGAFEGDFEAYGTGSGGKYSIPENERVFGGSVVRGERYFQRIEN